MALTTDDVKLLTQRFPAGQHGFLKHNGKPYVEEAPIATRLDSVDPSWELRQTALYQRDAQVVCCVELTIKGVTRSGVGMQDILNNAKGDEVNEAEKGAATDAFKRAARLFGIGRYLLLAPDTVRDYDTLKAWFDKADAKREGGQENPAPAEPKTEAPATPKGNGNAQEATPPKWWKAVTTDKELVALAGSQELLAVMVKDALKEGKMKPDDTVQMAKDLARELATAEIPF